MCVQNLKPVALPVPEIIWDTQNKIWAVSGSAYAHAPFPPKFLMDGSYEDTGQI